MSPKSTPIIDDDFQVKLRNAFQLLEYSNMSGGNSVKEATASHRTQKFVIHISNIVLKDGVELNLDPFHDMRMQTKNARLLFEPFLDLIHQAEVQFVTVDSNQETEEYITVFGKHKNPINVPVDDVEYIQSEGNYSFIFTTDGTKHVVKRSAQQLVENVDKSNFLRIQRSTFVNKSKLVRVSFVPSKVFTNNHELRVSKSFKKNIYEFHHLE